MRVAESNFSASIGISNDCGTLSTCSPTMTHLHACIHVQDTAKLTLNSNIMCIHHGDVIDEIGWANSSLTCVPSSIRQPERREGENSISSHLSTIVISPLVDYGRIEVFNSSNTTCEGVALSQYWSSTSSDLDRDGRSWKEEIHQCIWQSILIIIIPFTVNMKLFTSLPGPSRHVYIPAWDWLSEENCRVLE